MLSALVVGAIVGVLVSLSLTWHYGLLVGWMATATVFVAWMWLAIWPMSASVTASHALREDPGRAVTDVLVLTASLASLIAVGLLLAGGSPTALEKDIHAGLSVASIALAWGAVHTVFTTQYARLYYAAEPPGGIDFNEEELPRYSDFAYLAFTIGMTFQVSDTDLKTKDIRATALRHGLLSYLFGAVIIAATINLVAGLGK